MTIDLAKDVEDFLQQQVGAGACANASELVNDLLRCVREQQFKPFDATPELEAWLLKSADLPVTPLTGADFEAIGERVRARHRRPGGG
jgi:Arc/MetJ-type ribon-helix-helix transcriptional regulator